MDDIKGGKFGTRVPTIAEDDNGQTLPEKWYKGMFTYQLNPHRMIDE